MIILAMYVPIGHFNAYYATQLLSGDECRLMIRVYRGAKLVWWVD